MNLSALVSPLSRLFMTPPAPKARGRKASPSPRKQPAKAQPANPAPTTAQTPELPPELARSRADWLKEHDAPAGDDIPRYSPHDFPFPVWSFNDLGRKPGKAARRTPRPIYGPEYNHKPATKAQTRRRLEAADKLDRTPRHAPPDFPFPVWSDRDCARWNALRDAAVAGGRGPGAGALPERSRDLKPWQRKALTKAARLKGGE